MTRPMATCGWWRLGSGRPLQAVLVALLVSALLMGGLPPPTAAAELADYAVLPPDITALYFPATQHNLAAGFLRHWWERGQLSLFGYPISEELVEQGVTVQYFERARFEYHPQYRGTPYEVQLTHLGRQAAQGHTHAAFERVGPVGESPQRDYFEATGHTLAYAFKTYWERNSGLLNFGYPISEELIEGDRTVQYFERARFEYFPEHSNSEFEVQLGLLGRRALDESRLTPRPAERLSTATTWTPNLAAEVAQRVRAERERIWLSATAEPITPFQAAVVDASIDIRRAPTTVGGRLSVTYQRHIVHVTGVARGEPIRGNPIWYQVSPSGGYVPAAAVTAFTPPTPPTFHQGRWIDINLSTFYATGYEGETPIYSAIITAGRDNRTPTGVFLIQRRVRSETMDSATVGFPKGHPEYYYLENVEYVQYITGQGHALHGNYWVHPSRFGRFSSNGCAGLLNADAAWFWQFASIGTVVDIHY